MFKLTAIISLVLIATWSQADSRRHKKDASEPRDFDSGGTMWAASLSCDSCGSECASACGTRHFRSCCFNYLRRKRGPQLVQYSPQNTADPKSLEQPKEKKYPVFLMENIPDFNTLPEYRPFDDFYDRFDM